MADIKGKQPTRPCLLDPAGNRIDQKGSEDGHTAISGLYNATTNTEPSNIGIISHARTATPGDTNQTVRTTGGIITDDIDSANIHAIDVASYMMAYDSANDQWDRLALDGGALLTKTDLDGVYAAVTNTDPDNVGVVWHTRLATPGDTEQTFRPTGVTGTDDATVHAIDVALHDEDGNAYTASNPVPVSLVSTTIGDEVHDFNDNGAVDIAVDASVNHDYTVTALKTLILKQVYGSASGSASFKLQVETGVGTGLYDTKDYGFVSASNGNWERTFPDPIEVAAGVKVRIVKTNTDEDPMCVYSVFNGIEI